MKVEGRGNLELKGVLRCKSLRFETASGGHPCLRNLVVDSLILKWSIHHYSGATGNVGFNQMREIVTDLLFVGFMHAGSALLKGELAFSVLSRSGCGHWDSLLFVYVPR